MIAGTVCLGGGWAPAWLPLWQSIQVGDVFLIQITRQIARRSVRAVFRKAKAVQSTLASLRQLQDVALRPSRCTCNVTSTSA